ncbi:MAG: Hsp20 family protein [Alphaproteobacteria bacterium]|nr:Hsp20 family protein [Alphaproteobacteria bacterium]
MTNFMTLATPLMRQTVGFDRFNDLFESLMRDSSEGFENYPPYNIEKHGDDEYRITMAVAGFTMDDLAIVLNDGVLSVSGKMRERDDEDKVRILHRGIATRSFERTFRLADTIQVTGAEMKDGLLIIHLLREIPEEKKPRMIPINSEGVRVAHKKKH